MSSKVIIILGSSDIEKLKSGLMYGKNAIKYGWLDDVKFFLFGGAEESILKNQELIDEIKTVNAVACKFIAKEKNIYEKLKELNTKTEYIGEQISNLIKDGYVPMVF